MFGALYGAEGSSHDALIEVAREFSPRIEVCGPREIALDLSCLAHLFGDARTIAAELRRTAAARGLRVRVAIAGTRTAARLLVHHRVGLTIVEPGTEAEALAPIPLALLTSFGAFGPFEPFGTFSNGNGSNDPNASNGPNGLIDTFRRWGLKTCGELASLPPDALAARLGQDAVALQRLARGDDPLPLVPAVPDERFEQAIDLEWPIDGLEPLSFVLGRLMEPLSAHLDRRGRGAAVLHVQLHLVTRTVHERSLQLPAPMRDARTLRTLVLLDLESHPPSAAIDRVVVTVDPTPARITQFSLLTRPLPSPERLSTLMARLSAFMGEDRCGSPVDRDSWEPGAFAMKPFAPRDSNVVHRDDAPRHRGTEVKKVVLGASLPRCSVAVNGVAVVALRRFRFPVPARVRVEDGHPVRVTTDRRGLSGGRVEQYAGPWRTSGGWWIEYVWDRDEWDVSVSDGATYRVFRERHSDAWFIEGIVD